MSITLASTLARFISADATPALASRTRARSFAPRDRLPARVIVVGAGMAGATAARFLDAAGFDVVLLDARDRAGGRIHSVPQEGGPIELGASWIHGPLGNPISALAVALGLDTARSTPRQSAVYYASPERPSVPSDTLLRAQDDLYFAAAAASSDPTTRDVPLHDWLQAHAHQLEPSLRDPISRAWALRTLSLIEGEDAERLGLEQFAIESNLEGGDRLVTGGYQRIIEALIEPLDVRLGERVHRVERNTDGVYLHTDSHVFSADAVVLTVPLGVLKARSIRFEPPLSSLRLDAIDELGFGTLDRIVLRYAEAFWDPSAHFLAFPDWAGPVASFLNHRAFGPAPVLTGFVVGSDARNLERSGEDALIDAAIEPLLHHFGDVAGAPVSALATRWAVDPSSLGAYSYVPPGSSLDAYDVLASPEPGGLFFAGESTVRDHPATVHGAFYSGLRAAEEATRFCTEVLA